MDTQVPIENRANLPDPEFARLAAVLATHHSMKHTLDWLLSQAPPVELTDMVTQDEFSHDFLVAYPSGLWLTYDST